MAVTRSWQTKVLEQSAPAAAIAPTVSGGFFWLLCASFLVAGALALVYQAKTQAFADEQTRLDRGELLNLNQMKSPADLLPFLLVFADTGEREQVAWKIFEYVQARHPLHNTGALARLRKTGRISLLLPFSRLKPSLVVRTPQEFRNAFLQWVALYFAGFWLVYLCWRWLRFVGDRPLLPALHLLTGFGFVLSISLRDPLRDTLDFTKFSWGVTAGCLLLLLPSTRLLHPRRFAEWCYTPLFLAFALFAALLRFGSGPTGNDSKVNLGPFQPVELIKILIVFFVAGYFARNWERLRDLREQRLRPLDVPRFSHTLPVMLAVAIALAMFFVLKDLGPALVVGFLFLAMFAVARGRAGLAALGVFLLAAGVYVGYQAGTPHTVVERIHMWLSPWDNDVRGGSQLAHSIWALSTGGLYGSGPGLGDPAMIPAGHTDLVLPSIGEEWGFAGVACILLLFGFLIQRGFRIARNAESEYGFFLALGLSALIAFEMLLISGGVLGAIPLSGVVSPFLSSGNTAMLANFLIFGILLAISNHAEAVVDDQPFRMPVRVLGAVLAACGLTLLGFAAFYQVLHDREFIARDTKVFEEDGVKRAQHNPRINSLAHELRRGNIYDRNGVLLASSDWAELDRHRAELEKLGVRLATCCSPLDSRHYPFGPALMHLLGDLRTGESFHATNASLIEHDSNAKLQGFADLHDLAPLVRNRHHPNDAGMRQLRAKDRDVHSTIDIRLQLRAAGILQKELAKVHREHGALVVLQPDTGDVLALVSQPEPHQQATPDELLDRARYGQYPPGSTFKLVTAIAALREDANLAKRKYHCGGTSDGRVGAHIPGWRKVIHDDIGDSAHGTLSMEQAIVVSCNAYFAQLGVFDVGPKRLSETAQLLDISAGAVADLKATMPFAAYGQGPVLVTPFKMARVAGAIANEGAMAQGRWVSDDSNQRAAVPREILPPLDAAFLARAMRGVVVSGTARRAFAGAAITVAGKTGTAQVDTGDPHSWFAGFAPYEGDRSHAIAFAIVVEHGGYGGQTAAPIARELVDAARELGILQ